MESDAFIYVSPQAAWFSIVRTVSPQFEDKAGKNAGNDRAGGDCNYSHSSEKWSLTLFIFKPRVQRCFSAPWVLFQQ